MSMTEERIDLPTGTTREPGISYSAVPRRFRRSRLWRSWMVAWVGATAIGIGNAALREAVFGDLTDLRAHQVSTATLLTFLTVYMWWLQRRRPLPTSKDALQIGAAWVALTVAFEFGLGLSVTGDSFADLVHNYNFAAGRVWALVPLWMLVGPEALRRAVAND